jgi:hypothetical protein
MNLKLVILLASTWFLCTPVVPQVLDTSLYTDVRGIHTFECQIHPRLPVYTFTLTGDTFNTISQIRVTTEKSGRPLQVLHPFTDEPPYKGSNYFQCTDLNFDGYKDIMLLDGWGSGGESYLVWLFDTVKAAFVPNKQLSQLPNISLDPNTQTICSGYREGWMAYGSQLYRFDGDTLLLLESDSTKWIESEKHFIRILRVRRNGMMKDSLREVFNKEDN